MYGVPIGTSREKETILEESQIHGYTASFIVYIIGTFAAKSLR